VNENIGMVIIKKKDFEIERKGGRIGILAAGTSETAPGNRTREGVVAGLSSCK
jgi:NCAIR mutase (PurE)-related protein